MNLSKIKLSQITFANIKGFLQGHWNKINENEEYENYMYLSRLAKANPQCLINKECPCKCEHPAKLYDPRECDEGCYKEFMSRDEFKTYRALPRYDEEMENLIDYIIEKLSNNRILFEIADTKYKGNKITKIKIL